MAVPDIPQLPEFDRPPVVETVLSAQFEPILKIGTVHFGLFWERIRKEFPTAEGKPSLEQVFERFGELPKRLPSLRFEVREDGKPERFWFVNEAGTEMIQLQVDRFIKNWRKTGDHDVYPRYEKAIKPGFGRDLHLFEDFLRDESLGTIKVNQCEVTYVNHIVSGDGWRGWSEVGKVFSFLTGMEDAIEDGAFALRFPIRLQGQQVGRLIVQIQPTLREKDARPMYVMNLTARGMIGTGTEFFDLGREAVVSGFAKLTTPAMHEVWGRTK